MRFGANFSTAVNENNTFYSWSKDQAKASDEKALITLSTRDPDISYSYNFTFSSDLGFLIDFDSSD